MHAADVDPVDIGHRVGDESSLSFVELFGCLAVEDNGFAILRPSFRVKLERHF
jgi:hypothetical protein